MQKPTLVIMAAGMGSRFGGLKQMTPVDPQGHFIMDYSIYDAIRAGFGKVVCVIKEEMRDAFEEKIGGRIRGFTSLAYVYQSLDKLPEGCEIPEGRTRPWGTAHAVLCAAPEVEGPFAVINADDFYGREAFAAMADFLSAPHSQTEHAMVGYELEKTLTENGSVSRGQCMVDENGYLTSITERTKIIKTAEGAAYTEDDVAYTALPLDTVVSMNLWGFQQSILDRMQGQFCQFLQQNMPENPMKAEFYLPLVSERLLQEKAGSIEVLRSKAQWYGVTYKEDLPSVVDAIGRMKAEGIYPDELWK